MSALNLPYTLWAQNEGEALEIGQPGQGCFNLVETNPSPYLRVTTLLNMPTSPISTVPIEIYGEIFLHYRTSNHSFWSPVILSAVCTSWRNAALRLPRLWANLALLGDKYGEHLMDLEDPFYRMVNESKDPRQKAKPLRRGLSRGPDVEEWLNRSGGCSLSVEYRHSTVNRSQYGGSDEATSLAVSDPNT